MLTWILAVVGLFVLQSLLAPAIRYFSQPEGVANSLKIALGPRDEQPPMPAVGARAARALQNMMEAMPVFLTLALLSMILGKPSALAERGAMLFFVARVLYVPAYMIGIFGMRSMVWVGGLVGLVMMALPLLGR